MLIKRNALIFGGLGLLVVMGILGFLFSRHPGAKKTVAQKQPASQKLSSPTGLSNGQSGVEADTSQDLKLYSSSGSNSTSSNSANSGSSNQAVIDPSTFSQYEKYKDGTAALFGEIKVGDGAVLEAGKSAAVLYKGWLTNGQVFDQSRAGSDGKLEPFTFTLGAHQVIPGWEQAMGGMKVGGARLLIIPPSVGYGASGQGPIPPNSVLVFQVQLLAVQ